MIWIKVGSKRLSRFCVGTHQDISAVVSIRSLNEPEYMIEQGFLAF